MVEFHCVRRAAFGAGPEIGCVTEHRGHRDETGDGLYTRSCGNSSDFSPSGMQIAEDISDVERFLSDYDQDQQDADDIADILALLD